MEFQVNNQAQPYGTQTVLQNGVQQVPIGVSNQQMQSPIMQPQGVQGQVSFTPEQQDMINNIVSGRVNEVSAKYQGKLTQLQQVAQSYANAQAELEQYKMNDVLNKSGVQPLFAKFVASEAKALAVNGKTFDVAVAEYLQANPQFGTQTVAQNQQMQQNAQTGSLWGTQTQQAPVNIQLPQTQVGTRVEQGIASTQQFGLQQQVPQQFQQPQQMVQQVIGQPTQPQVQQVVQQQATQPIIGVLTQPMPNGVQQVPVYQGASGVNPTTFVQAGQQTAEQTAMSASLAKKGYKFK